MKTRRVEPKTPKRSKKKAAKPKALPPARMKVGETRGNLAGRAGWFEQRTGKTA
jgi:hypothetical protein